MISSQHWPARLWLVRHGQSQGNVARDKAYEAGLATIDLSLRDVDVPLSDLGHRQAAAAGRWFAGLPASEKPEILLSSPYIRARQTAEAICTAGGLAGGAKPTIVDERLREREFGVFDGLTTLGIKQQYADEAKHRARLGKFYYRPWRRKLGRCHTSTSLRAEHHQSSICRQAGACGLPPGCRALSPLHS